MLTLRNSSQATLCVLIKWLVNVNSVSEDVLIFSSRLLRVHADRQTRRVLQLVAL